MLGEALGFGVWVWERGRGRRGGSDMKGLGRGGRRHDVSRLSLGGFFDFSTLSASALSSFIWMESYHLHLDLIKDPGITYTENKKWPYKKGGREAIALH